MDTTRLEAAPLSDPLSTYIEAELRKLNEQFSNLEQYGETVSTDQLLRLDPPLRIAYHYRQSLIFARRKIAEVDQRFEAIIKARPNGEEERGEIMKLRDHFLNQMGVQGDPILYFMYEDTSTSIFYELLSFLGHEKWPSTTSRRPPFRQRWSKPKELSERLDKRISNLHRYLTVSSVSPHLPWRAS